MIRLLIVSASAIGLILFVAFVAARFARSLRTGISIRLQVFIALAAIVGAFALGLGIIVVDRVEARATRLALGAAAGEARAIAYLLSIQADASASSLREIAGPLQAEQGALSGSEVEILDPEGRTLVRSGATLEPDEASASIDAPISRHGRVLGQVRVRKPTLEMRRLLEDVAPTILAISLVLGSAAALAAAWIGRAIARPIEALSAFSESVSSGVGATPPPLGAAREVRRLGHSIDSMRRQLEGRTFVETFAADLSHELKNPVAAIRASGEVLEDSALDDPQKGRLFVARILEATSRIEHLLEDLLSLASIEARGLEEFAVMHWDQVVSEVLDTVVERSRVRYEHRGDTRVRGDRQWLARAVSNLVDNALGNSQAGLVEIVLSRDGPWVVLGITNPGEVSATMQKHLFRRFATTRRDAGGTGLGLAIVQAVAQSHRGTVQLLLAGPPLVHFELRLPGVQAPAVHQLREAVAEATEPLSRSKYLK